MARLNVFLSSAILLPGILFLAGCATTAGQHQPADSQPAVNKAADGNLQTTLQQLIDSNIVSAIAANALAKHSIVDYVSAALDSLQKTYSLDLSALTKQLTPANANFLFYKGVYIAYSKRKDVAPQEINQTALEAMLKLVDSRSRFYDATAYREIRQALGKKGEIGVVLSQDRQGIRLVQVMPGSPAEKAGLPVAGHIVSINNKNIHKWGLSDANILLRGEPGSTVNVAIAAPGGGSRSYALKRVLLQVNNVEIKKLKHNILYIRIGYFDSATKKRILEEAARLHYRPTGVILDLRVCSGGNMKSIVGVGDLFLPGGDFLNIRNSNPLFDTNFNTRSGEPLENMRNIAILVSSATASGAEGIAVVLQHRANAKIIGSRTAGGNVIQSIFPLRDGSAIKLTTGRLDSADGTGWSEHGVRPDVCIDYAKHTLVKPSRHGCGFSYYDSKANAGRDFALGQALHYLSRRH